MAKQVGLNTWLNRTTNQFLIEISSGGMTARFPGLLFDDGAGQPINNADWIHAPDLDAVTGFPDTKYWIVTGDVVSLMSQAARDALDAAADTVQLDSIADELTQTRTFIRAFAEVVLDEINNLRSQHALPPRTLTQLRNAVRGKL